MTISRQFGWRYKPCNLWGFLFEIWISRQSFRGNWDGKTAQKSKNAKSAKIHFVLNIIHLQNWSNRHHSKDCPENKTLKSQKIFCSLLK